MSDVSVQDRLVRRCALGLRFRDTATGDTAIDGLQVEVYVPGQGGRRTPALPNRSGVYVAQALPGLRDFEFGQTSPDAPWPVAARSLRVSISDPQRRFLPMSFDALAPTLGLFGAVASWLSPPQPFGFALLPDDGSPPSPLFDGVPLFSSPNRPVPDPLAVVYAQLREVGSSTPAAWALLGVSIGGRGRGLGLADQNGRVAVLFPYPEPARRRLASPPEPRNDFSWSLDLTIYSATGSPPLSAAEPPQLEALLAQLQQPRSVVWAQSPPAAPLRLDYRVPVTARSGASPLADASFLYFA